MASDVDEAQRHAIFFGKVTGVAGVFYQMVETVKIFPVEKPAGDDAQEKNREEKYVGVSAIGMSEASVDGIASYQAAVGRDSHGAVHEIVQEKAEEAEGQTAVKQIIAFVPCQGAWKNGRHHKTQHDAAQKGKNHTGDRDNRTAEGIGVSQSVTEQEFADKRAEAGGKHAYVKIFLKI